ncbi:hypothetical protein [Rickettsia australis]|uniref:hypothetical protein n=1 Tax=Rickettsia australis TaxID=787 RepID=UPI0002EE350E|nr:hypothetical protein [Rickettsia australis]
MITVQLPLEVFIKEWQIICHVIIPFYVDQTTEEHLEDDIKINIDEFIKFLKPICKLLLMFLWGIQNPLPLGEGKI